MKYSVVIDTNVLVSALRSRNGASYRLLSILDNGMFSINVSVVLVLQYEDASKSLIGRKYPLSEKDIDDIIDYICQLANHQQVFYLWRPFLKDPGDDMVLELAVAAQANIIVTYNKNDFQGVKEFGIEVLTPKEFLERIGGFS